MCESVVHITDTVSIPMSELHSRFAHSGKPDSSDRIEATGRLIDRIVCMLYGLLEEEIAVVKGLDHE